ncbi:hypothetical protein KCP71_15025 [Salmonella enterica subsp. enterica]|nr:hypothetical protein KCP71_15025 [Salmonella enterica subsp. enterica]
MSEKSPRPLAWACWSGGWCIARLSRDDFFANGKQARSASSLFVDVMSVGNFNIGFNLGCWTACR